MQLTINMLSPDLSNLINVRCFVNLEFRVNIVFIVFKNIS